MKNRTAQQSANLGTFANLRDRVTLVENWLQKPGINADIIIDPDADSASALVAYVIANKNFEVLGTNGTTALCTFAAGGGITLTTAGASADQMIVLPHLDTTQTAWTATLLTTSVSPACAARIVTGASIADTTIWYGLKKTNTSVLATDSDQAFFRYGSNHATLPTKLVACYSVSGTDYEIDTGIVLAASTVYDLEVSIDADRVPRFYVGVAGKPAELVAVGTAMTASVTLIPYVGVQADTAAAKAITVKPGYAVARD